MKNFFSAFLILFSTITFAQDTKFGITVGATNYVTDTNLLFSKSAIGFTIGGMMKTEFNDRSQLLLELNYNSHFVNFVGRKNELATPEDIKFKLEEISIPVSYNYSFIVLDEFRFGINAGPSFHFIHEYKIVDESKEQYLLDPLQAQANDLLFDTRNDEMSFNIFLALGLSIQYKDSLMANLKYYYGITDPYRRAPIYSTVLDISGKDSFLAFSVTYFFLTR